MNKEVERIEGQKLLSIESANSTPDFIERLDVKAEGFKLTYYLWLSRMFIVTAVFSLLVMLSVSLSLFKLAPMVTVEPFLMINQSSSDGITRDEPISFDMASKEKLMEIFIRQYIILRNTIINDPVEMRTRWLPGGMLHFFSSEDIFNRFYDVTKKQWPSLFRNPLTREVEIISIGKQGGKKSKIWKVDFKTYDMVEGVDEGNNTMSTVLRTRYWTASVTANFVKERRFLSYRLMNPLGFTVVRYSQAEVELY